MTQPYKRILTVDAETRWASKPTDWCADGFSLRKITTESYIRSPLFKAFGFCIHEYGTDQPITWYSHEELPSLFASIDWTETAVLAHNAMFDVGILSMVYGVQPCFIFDSLSMARALRGVEVGNSLMKLADAFGLPPKGRAVHSTDGLWELPAHIETELAEYCKHDVFLCEEIFTRLLTGMHGGGKIHDPYPTKELRLIDMTLRMFTCPQLTLDVPMLEKARDEENEKLRVALERVGVAESDLASNDKFAAILEGLGVTPPTKKKRPTPKTPNPVGENFAFAKNDAHFQQLLNGDNEDVALLCEARLRVKSTLERTRSQRFIDIASRGNLPIPLKYYGAETGRWSGTDQVNLQNMKRGSFLRKAIMAPKGYVVGVMDLAQIEPRVLAWLAGYESMLDIFRAGVDTYAAFGSQMFSIPGLTAQSHPVERQSAKSATLGCGFQLGWAAFAAQLLVGFLGAPPKRYTKAEAIQLGVTKWHVDKFINNEWHMTKMMEIAHTCTDEELLIHCLAAKAIVEKYRATAEPVVGFWKLLQERIVASLIGGEEYNHKDVLLFRKEEIVLANGMSLKYPNIEITKDDRGRVEYRFGASAAMQKLYAGRVCNNCIGEGTPVLTSRGWVAIESVKETDAVHDGVEFVVHAGSICNGVQTCVTVDGVYMTPDHEVLTNDGWKKASQFPRPYRPNIRYVDCASTGVHESKSLVLALPMRLRQAVCSLRAGRVKGPEERPLGELWVHDKDNNARKDVYARDVKAPGVYMLAQHDEPLLQDVGARLQKLWRARHQGVQALARFCEFLGGHGRRVPIGAYFGAHQKQPGVQPEELRLGNAQGTSKQHPCDDSRGKHTGVECRNRNRAYDPVQPAEVGLAGVATVPQAGILKSVFDIMNCGPRSRFVVLGAAGPFIVHNCTQGTARIIMSDGLLRIDKCFDVVGSSHDEGLFLLPEKEAAAGLAWTKAQMVVEPKWMKGIPLNASGDFAKRYGDAKT